MDANDASLGSGLGGGSGNSFYARLGSGLGGGSGNSLYAVACADLENFADGPILAGGLGGGGDNGPFY